MNFCQTSLISFKKILQALTDAEVAVSAELQQIAVTSLVTSLNTTMLSHSNTSMALSQLGLIDRMEAGSNLSV